MKRRQLGIASDLQLDRVTLASVLLAGGFLYAYIASAPILVFHYSRYFVLGPRHRGKLWIGTNLLIILVSVIVARILRKLGVDCMVSFFAGVAFGFWFCSWILSTASFIWRKNLFEFYTALSAKRTKENEDFVESYRTLREHGNAFYIILCEIMLAAIVVAGLRIYKVQDVDGGLLLALWTCLIWIAPAAVAWTIAGNLERDFIDKK